jgi:hypothetical protein
LELSSKNNANSETVTNPHHLGSRGYTRKMPEFAAELEKMDPLVEQGIEVETAKWEPRSVIYCMGRKVCHDEDGSFSSTNQPMNDLIQRIPNVTKEVIQGTRTSNKEKDVLTQALRNTEHPGRTRGTNVVPWKLAF